MGVYGLVMQVWKGVMLNQGYEATYSSLSCASKLAKFYFIYFILLFMFYFYFYFLIFITILIFIIIFIFYILWYLLYLFIFNFTLFSKRKGFSNYKMILKNFFVSLLESASL